MSKTPRTTDETEAAPPRFIRVSSGVGTHLRDPIPDALAERLPAKLIADHKKLAGRIDEQAREVARLRQAIRDAPAADREAGKQAALAGKPVPQSSEPRLRAELAEAERVQGALNAAIVESGDRLLKAAQPEATALADTFDRELHDGTEAVRARILDLADALRELSGLHAEAAWIRWLAGATGETVRPFQAGSSAFKETLGHLTTVGEAFTFELNRVAEHRTEFERRAREQADQNAEFDAERERQEAAKEASER
ncbi:MAG: hypothetical protein ACRDPZ_03550 [Gaiellaceae bacterium]